MYVGLNGKIWDTCDINQYQPNKEDELRKSKEATKSHVKGGFLVTSVQIDGLYISLNFEVSIDSD